MTEFFHMGGYAFYVWTSWGVSAAGLFALYLMRASRLRRAHIACANLEET